MKIGTIELNNLTPKICVPLVAADTAGILQQAAAAGRADADLAELRIDFFAAYKDTGAVLKMLRQLNAGLDGMPVIFTLRSQREGGQAEADAEDYCELYPAVIESGLVQAVDIEIYTVVDAAAELIDLARRRNVRTILSNHDFVRTPPEAEIMNRFADMDQLNGDIFKIAYMPQRMNDIPKLMNCALAGREMYPDHELITIAMGPDGLVSRLCPRNFGSCLTFASAGAVSAPGQMPTSLVRQVLDIDKSANI